MYWLGTEDPLDQHGSNPWSGKVKAQNPAVAQLLWSAQPSEASQLSIEPEVFLRRLQTKMADSMDTDHDDLGDLHMDEFDNYANEDDDEEEEDDSLNNDAADGDGDDGYEDEDDGSSEDDFGSKSTVDGLGAGLLAQSYLHSSKGVKGLLGHEQNSSSFSNLFQGKLLTRKVRAVTNSTTTGAAAKGNGKGRNGRKNRKKRKERKGGWKKGKQNNKNGGQKNCKCGEYSFCIFKRRTIV